MNLLGIDFGLRKIGLAVSEEDLIRPLGVVCYSPKIISKIGKICQEYQITKIVIGLSEGELGRKIKKFAQELQEAVGIEVEFQDENLTTHEAIATMIKLGKKRKKRRVLKDAFAAGIILQGYLQERRRNV